jgi:hypothetical protein
MRADPSTDPVNVDDCYRPLAAAATAALSAYLAKSGRDPRSHASARQQAFSCGLRSRRQQCDSLRTIDPTQAPPIPDETSPHKRSRCAGGADVPENGAPLRTDDRPRGMAPMIRTIHTIAEAETVYAQLIDSAAKTAAWLRGFDKEPMALLKALRFEMVGHDPLTGEPLNVVEQLNQTFTIMVTMRAIECLIALHPEAGGFRLALGTSSGRDIESVVPALVAAEVFSATHPASNQKLKKDVARLAADPAQHRYAFFAAPGYAAGRQLGLETVPGVQVHAVEL